MFNKNYLMLLATLFLISACTTNPNGISSEEFAMSANVESGYKQIRITGERIHPVNLTTKTELLVSKAEVYTILNVSTDNRDSQYSTVVMMLSFIDNYMYYGFVNINGETTKVKKRSESVRQCDDLCTKTQYFSFPVKTSALIEARETGLTFSINREETSNDFIFEIPANYIDGSLKRVENEQNRVIETNSEIKSLEFSASKEIEMTQYWFNEATLTEKELFTDWAFKNRKKITTSLNGETKALEMLEYWYEKASSAEKAQILSWVISQ